MISHKELQEIGAEWLYKRQGYAGITLLELSIGMFQFDVVGLHRKSVKIKNWRANIEPLFKLPIHRDWDNNSEWVTTVRGLEVKVSRSDFLSELRKQKQDVKKFYLDYFWFLTPPNIIWESDYPKLKNIGVLEYNNGEIKVVKKASKLHPFLLSEHYRKDVWCTAAMKLFYKE